MWSNKHLTVKQCTCLNTARKKILPAFLNVTICNQLFVSLYSFKDILFPHTLDLNTGGSLLFPVKKT